MYYNAMIDVLIIPILQVSRIHSLLLADEVLIFREFQ